MVAFYSTGLLCKVWSAWVVPWSWPQSAEDGISVIMPQKPPCSQVIWKKALLLSVYFLLCIKSIRYSKLVVMSITSFISISYILRYFLSGVPLSINLQETSFTTHPQACKRAHTHTSKEQPLRLDQTSNACTIFFSKVCPMLEKKSQQQKRWHCCNVLPSPVPSALHTHTQHTHTHTHTHTYTHTHTHTHTGSGVHAHTFLTRHTHRHLAQALRKTVSQNRIR